MVLLLPGAMLVIAVAGLLVLRIWGRRLRVDGEACPSCGHPVQGLVDPRCPECGGDLEAGVVGRGRIHPRRALWLGLLNIVLGVSCSTVLILALGMNWVPFLTSTGRIHRRAMFDRLVEVGIDESNRLQVECSADYVVGNAGTAGGRVEVLLLSKGRRIATWKGTGPINAIAVNRGIIIQSMVIVESLRSQVPAEDPSPFARILHDPIDADILAGVIDGYAAPTGGVSAGIRDSRGEFLFRGGISTTGKNQIIPVYPSAIWFAPVYVIPGLVLLAYLCSGVLVLTGRHRLQPFERHASTA
ncbi:MAG: hypothetical protein GY895_16410 [Phycisphaera sp.]|nr:hypothetical protein [Phycisphaera sp.]